MGVEASSEFDPSRHKPGRILALQRAPDLMLANPVCCRSGQGSGCISTD
jgi:hypothetical protein